MRIAGLTAICLVWAGSLSPALAQAEDEGGPPPFPEFSFRRITVPDAGYSGARINIQIGAEQAAASPVPDAQAVPLSTAWFWDQIPPGRDDGAGRFMAAIRLLETAPEAAALQIAGAEILLALSDAHDLDILRATIGTRVSPALVLAIMAVESRGDLMAQSSAGAQGLMQLIPATAERFGVTDSFDATQNIAGGVAYLDWLMEEFDRDPVLALAGYNAGEGAVDAANGVPDYPETRDYVIRVLATWRTARLLCVTPPELVSDGCVLQTMLDG
jgi:Transglycosylase SLT domain